VSQSRSWTRRYRSSFRPERDSATGKISQVARSADASLVRFAGSARERAAIYPELGYRASGLAAVDVIELPFRLQQGAREAISHIRAANTHIRSSRFVDEL
jgi:hypothetical protein